MSNVNLNLDSVISYVVDLLASFRTITVTIGGVTVDLLSVEIGIILICMIIFFVNTFSGGDDI